jgi:hypothetical protein
MKSVFTKLTLFSLFISLTVFATDKTTESQKLYHGAAYKEGVLIINVKPQYRSLCSDHSIQVAQLKNALDKISFISVDKKFPYIQEPKEKVNKYGKKLVDLSLIYQVKFSPAVDIEKAMAVVNASGVVEYAEPHYIHEMYFIPNDTDIVVQYAIGKINAYNAWDVWTGDTNTVIGIVDSGTDWDHPDLQGNTKYNWNDPIDGIDNDNDGFVDNFRGWDVSENDNDPTVVSSFHGSHVSGCADAVTNNTTGIASPAYNCKFFGVKTSLDNSQVIDNGYDGIVYAADHGANIINCSWGRTGFRSVFEQQTIDYCTFNKDVLVVAAAGNDGMETDHYPSSYANVISVAATQSNDNVANYSNYGVNIDVCAPGSNIYATWYNDSYASLDGTSMASPIAAGCAAMIKSRFPSLNALQVGEQLRTTCDNIYNVGTNIFYQSKLGKGRVNLFKAVTDSLSPGVIVQSNRFTDRADEVYLPGDTIDMITTFENLLRPTANLTCSLVTTSPDVTIIQNNFNAGVLNTFDTLSNFTLPYRIYVKPNAALNSEVALQIILTDGAWTDFFLAKIVVNVDYVNIAINNVGTSISSKSLIGYNQTGQLQGLGFTYKGSPTILYDMGLMVGAAGTQVSDNMRGAAGNDEDFASVVNVVAHDPGSVSDFDVNGVMRDNGPTSSNPLNIIIRHNAYAWVSAPDDNYVMVQYWIRNAGATTLDNLWAGIFADWDIPQYQNNKCATDISRRMGYIWSTDSAGLYGGIKLLSHTGGFNHYALDNTAGNGGIDMTNGYDNNEKYQSLSTSRSASGTATQTGNDVLSVVSSGPFTVAAGDSVQVTFALLAGKDLPELQSAADAAQTKYNNVLGLEPISVAHDNFIRCYPNPADRQVRFEFSITERNVTELSIYDLSSKKIRTVLNEQLQSGRYTVLTDITMLPSGNYMVKLQSGSYRQTIPVSVVR